MPKNIENADASPLIQSTGSRLSKAQYVKLFAAIEESERLETLTPLELVKEVLRTETADSLIVEELMNRVCPNWQETIHSENAEHTGANASGGAGG